MVSSYLINDETLSGYDIEIHEIPLKYKKQVLINGENSFDKSGDFRSLEVNTKANMELLMSDTPIRPLYRLFMIKLKQIASHLRFIKKG